MAKRLTRAEVDETVRQELDEMFVRLAKTWEIESGDTEPMETLAWEERTVPAILDFCWSLYRSNLRYERVTIQLREHWLAEVEEALHSSNEEARELLMEVEDEVRQARSSTR